MDYDDSLRWLLTLPDFERTGDFADRPDLAPMLALLAELADPHLGRPTVHVAGSKGKGSTAVMVEAILEAAGVRTGCYISPHLHRYNERIRIGAKPVEREAFAAATTAVREAIDRVAPSFPEREFLAFDALTAAGFVAFRDARVEAQVIEVGLGGTLDSTNVFHVKHDGEQTTDNRPDAQQATDNRQQTGAEEQRPGNEGSRPHVAVLAPISLEHTAILGSTIKAIAEQKAGIITDGCATVVAPQRESAIDVFRAVAGERGATFIEVAAVCQMARTRASAEGQEFRLKTARGSYAGTLPLAGRHQLDNAATAIVASEELAERAGIELTADHVRRGLAAVTWPARLEVLKRRPYVIVDGAHNGDSAKRMAAALRDDFGLAHCVVLFGTLEGKDIEGMAAAVAPLADHVFVTGWASRRAADPRAVAAAFSELDAPVMVMGDLAQAFEAAMTHAGERGAVVAFGSLAFAAAVREHVLGIESDTIRLAAARRDSAS